MYFEFCPHLVGILAPPLVQTISFSSITMEYPQLKFNDLLFGLLALSFILFFLYNGEGSCCLFRCSWWRVGEHTGKWNFEHVFLSFCTLINAIILCFHHSLYCVHSLFSETSSFGMAGLGLKIKSLANPFLIEPRIAQLTK